MMLGFWPMTVDSYYQHEARGRASVAVSAGMVRVEVFGGIGWWGRPDAKVPHSPFNLEASRTLERVFGGSVLVGKTFGVGAMAYRRGVDELDRERAWGQHETEHTHRWSIGYYDGVRPLVWAGPVMLYGPIVINWNGGTLPWHNWMLRARWWWLGFDGALGGTREGAVADFHVRVPVYAGVLVGVDAGWIELPGWSRDLPRIALGVTLFSPTEVTPCFTCSLW
jgi:hypothetical protein